MSSLMDSPYKMDSLFKTYLVNQDETEEKSEEPTEQPTDPKTAWSFRGYTPKRANWHTVQGKIKSYLA
jgi:predicted DNA-binding helix-hairpin-helix protein